LVSSGFLSYVLSILLSHGLHSLLLGFAIEIYIISEWA